MQVWLILLEKLNNVNIDNKLLKNVYKKAQPNQAVVAKARTSTENADKNVTKVGKNQLGKQKPRWW